MTFCCPFVYRGCPSEQEPTPRSHRKSQQEQHDGTHLGHPVDRDRRFEVRSSGPVEGSSVQVRDAGDVKTVQGTETVDAEEDREDSTCPALVDQPAIHRRLIGTRTGGLQVAIILKPSARSCSRLAHDGVRPMGTK